MHSVFQRLLKVKWDLFGKKGVLSLVAINVFYTLIWTLLGILLPRDGKYYAPLTSNWWRIILEITGVGMTVYFMCMVSLILLLIEIILLTGISVFLWCFVTVSISFHPTLKVRMT